MMYSLFFFLLICPHPTSPRTAPPFPYPTLFRSGGQDVPLDQPCAQGQHACHAGGQGEGSGIECDPRPGAQQSAKQEGEPEGCMQADLAVVGAAAPSGQRLTKAGDLSRSEEHTYELQSIKSNPYAIFCVK